MAVTGVVRFKLGKVQDVTNFISAYSKSARGIKIVLSVFMKKPRKKAFVSR